MDPTLAQLFGTMDPVEVSEEEMQKTAQLQLLAKIAEDQGIDLDQLSDEQIMEAYSYLQEAGQEKVASEQHYESEADTMTKEAAEMAQNAETMGRIMAHAYVDELKGIQKAAMMKAAEEDEEEEKKESKNPLVAAMKGEKKDDEEKEKDAFDQAVEYEAIEMLKAAGAINQDGTLMSPEQYRAAAGYADETVVKTAALQTLEAMGYPVNWE